MNAVQKKRFFWVVILLSGVSFAVFFVLVALRENVNLFYTPTQVAEGGVSPGKHFRVGGMVVKGSVIHGAKGLAVSFALTDTANTLTVRYDGILPDLFREGQGIVAEGQLDASQVFVADRVLAKHDENYMPPEVAYSLKRAKEIKHAT